MKNIIGYYLVLVMIFIAASSCKKIEDPYYNPKFKPGSDIETPIFFTKIKMTGDEAFTKSNPDSFIYKSGTKTIINVAGGPLFFYPVDSPKTTNYLSEFWDASGSSTDYIFRVIINLPDSSKTKLMKSYIKNNYFMYASPMYYRNMVKIEFKDKRNYYFHTCIGSDYLNWYSNFNILNVSEYYTDAKTPNNSQYKIKMAFSCYAICDYDGSMVKLEGEATMIF